MNVSNYGHVMGPTNEYAGAFANVLTEYGFNAMPICRAD
jgi:hypothetical protein